MSKEVIQTDKAPAAIGPYSQAIKCGGVLFISGQIPVDPDTGEIVAGDIKAQTKRVLDNLKAILAAAGLDLSAVVKTTVYLSDMNDFPEMNEVYADYFSHAPPARATVQVAGLPKGVSVEIDAIAVCEQS